MNAEQPWNLDIATASALLADGALTATELTEACIERIEATEPTIRSFAEFDADRARTEAKAADELRRSNPDVSPLNGIPIGIKDIMDVEGYRTRAGSDVLSDASAADGDAPAVAALRDAGAIIMGKTTTHEFAYGCETPPTRNPWDPDRIAGGSSGGSGAAVAAGQCLGALGSDSGGSIRIPSALCGLTGLRPRVGSISLDRTVPFSATHDTVGPMAQSARDAALMWDALTGARPESAIDLTTTRIAVPEKLEGLGDFDDDLLDSINDAVSILEAAGATLVPVSIPPFSDWNAGRTIVVLSEFLAEHRAAGWYDDRFERYSPELQRYFRRAGEISGADLILARRELNQLAARIRSTLDHTDLLVLPTVATHAPRASAVDSDRDVGITENTMRLLQTTAPIGYTGLASLAVPTRPATNGLPLGVQFIAHEESDVLGAGMAFQEISKYHLRRPSL